jgi:diketogulonate reductase-like aldo/keto reductase
LIAKAWVQENIGSFDIDLSEDVIEDIERVYKRYRDPTTKPIDE